MKLDSLEAVFVYRLKDLYSPEDQRVEALQKCEGQNELAESSAREPIPRI